MASPTDAGRTPTSVTGATDPWTVNLPASIASGDLLIMYLRANNSNGVLAATPSGWTRFGTQDDQSDASNDCVNWLYRWADGGEGSTVSVDMSNTCKGAGIVWRITGAVNPSTQAPEITSAATGTGANCDPGTISPTGGSKDYLFLAAAGLDGETQTFTLPTNYSNLQEANSGTGGLPDTNVRIGAGSRQLTASSEDPGTFTNGAPSTGWMAYTVAIHPAGGATEFPQALTATLTTVATATKQTAKTQTAVVSAVGTVTKQVGKSVTAALNLVASMVAIKVILLELTAAVSLAASMTRQVGKTLTDSVTLVATIGRQIGKQLTAAVSLVASVTKQVSKALTAVVNTVASLTAIKVFLVVMTAAVSAVASMTRQTGKVLTAPVTFSVTVTRQVGKVIVAPVTFSVTITRAMTKTLTAVVSTVATQVAQFISGSAAVITGYFQNRLRGVSTSTPDEGDFDPPNPGGRNY